MNILRSPKSECIAAFLLGGLIALLAATPGRGAEPFRLERLGIVQISPAAEGRLDVRSGVLDLAGRVAWRGTQNIPRPASMPEWALGRPLVNLDFWLALHSLGTEATANFEIQEKGGWAAIGNQYYLAVAVSEYARIATGQVVNISTLARVAAGGDVVIAGFVIEDRPRAVLLRAIGPGLAPYNVAGPTPDPFLSLKREDVTIYFNDNWATGPDLHLIEAAAARDGAFPLDRLSRDAARLVLLPPGVYTLHVQTASPDVPGGRVLVEVYSVPEDVFDSN